MALLGAQAGSSSVKLLGYDTQELSLVLSPVAVGGADVHHLEGWRGTHGDRDRRERDRGRVSVGRTEGGPKTTSSRDEATQSLFRSEKSTSLECNCRFIDEKRRTSAGRGAERVNTSRSPSPWLSIQDMSDF